MARVGIVGGFDVGNFGDVLFPELAERELARRLGNVDLIRYGYREMTADAWFYPVRSLGRLRHDVDDLDLVIVGGGQIIRLDPHVAAGYLPDDPTLHHPTAFWILPSLLAAAARIPLAYNTPGVSDIADAWAQPLARAALAAADHLAVRDHDSAARIYEVWADADVQVVPDTAFGITPALPVAPSDEWRAFLAASGIAERYLVLQCSPQLRPYADRLRPALEQAAADGIQILALASGPILGDGPDEVPPGLPVHHATAWPPPLLLAELLARAQAVVAQSFHMTVVAAASGVPVHLPESWPGFKWTAIEPLRDVHPWPREGSEPIELTLGHQAPGVDARERASQVDAHWDAIARLLDGSPSPAGSEALAKLLTELPHVLSRQFA